MSAIQGSTRQTSKLRAQEFERRLRSQVDTGQEPFYEPPTIEELLTLYFGWLEANRSAQHTDRAKRALRNVLDRMPGVRTPADVTSLRIENFKKRRLREVSPHTVNLELGCLRAFLKRCIKQGWLRDMPLQIERVTTPTPGKLIFLKESEIEPFLENLKPYTREAARFILLTGLRLDEARFLEWQDLDLETGELWVRDKPQFGILPKECQGKGGSAAARPRRGTESAGTEDGLGVAGTTGRADQ